MSQSKKALKSALSETNKVRKFDLGEPATKAKGMKAAYRTACENDVVLDEVQEYSANDIPVPRSVLHIINMMYQIIMHTKPHLGVDQVGHGYSEIEGEYSIDFWDDLLDEEDPDAVMDPDYYNDLTDVLSRLDAHNFYETVFFDFDHFRVSFTDKMDMYKILHDFIVDPEEPLVTPDSLRIESPTCEDTFALEDMPSHLSLNEKERLLGHVTEQVQQQFEETQRKYRLGHVSEQWANDTPESNSMFRTVPPRGYLSREDFLDACYYMPAVPLTDSLGHILKLIMHEDKAEEPAGSYGYFLTNSYGGHH